MPRGKKTRPSSPEGRGPLLPWCHPTWASPKRKIRRDGGYALGQPHSCRYKMPIPSWAASDTLSHDNGGDSVTTYLTRRSAVQLPGPFPVCADVGLSPFLRLSASRFHGYFSCSMSLEKLYHRRRAMSKGKEQIEQLDLKWIWGKARSLGRIRLCSYSFMTSPLHRLTRYCILPRIQRPSTRSRLPRSP